MVTLTRNWATVSDNLKGGPKALLSANQELFPRRARAIYDPPNGKGLAFSCHDHLGNYYFCKDDHLGHPSRATEMIFTRLADWVGIRTADWAVIEHENSTFFGSLNEVSSAEIFRARDFLTTPQCNELGQPSHFPGEYLAQLRAFDLFIGNPDRGLNNFLVVEDGSFPRICAIDFADAYVGNLASQRFPVASCHTVIVGKLLAGIHGAFVRSAIEMVDRIAAIPPQVFLRLVRDVPNDWLSPEDKGGLDAIWGSPGFQARLVSLRSGLTDGTLV